MPLRYDRLDPANIARRFANDLPRLVGNTAVNFFKDRFRKQNWQDGASAQPWSKRNATLSHNRSGANMLVDSGRLRRSIRIARADSSHVTVATDTPYAKLHNEGGSLKITAKMKKFFWAMYYKTMGKHGEMRTDLAAKRIAQLQRYAEARANGTAGRFRIARYSALHSKLKNQKAEALAWRGLALKKVGSSITIPKRQFMGESQTLNDEIQRVIVHHISQFFQ